MFDLDALVRPNILQLQPYSSARDEFKAGSKAEVFLDANENPFGALNRYPDPYQRALKARLSELKGLSPAHIFVGNGSDEVIDLAFRIFCRPGKDAVALCPPTYGMYEVAAQINDAPVLRIPLDADFAPDLPAIVDSGAKMVFLCSPNNPTGNRLEGLETVVRNFPGIVFVDEAYIDFSSRPSLLLKVIEYPNLIVSQTLSKAWGKAGIRIGMAYAQPRIIDYYNKVKPPYNVSQIDQEHALQALEGVEEMQARCRLLLSERRRLEQSLPDLPGVVKVYPSDANFLLVKTTNAGFLYRQFLEQGIVLRNRHSLVEQCLRITIGTPQENNRLLQVWKQIRMS